jgi:ketosteroid isomerase-like protein
MPDSADLIAQLSSRLEALEDEREVRNVITRYCFAVDSDDPDATEKLYAEDCVVDVDNKRTYRGKEVRNIVTGKIHQSILPNCSHLFAPFLVKMDGKRATATGYATVAVKNTDAEGSRIWRQSYNRFELEKRAAGWLIVKRQSVSVGSKDAQALLNQAL